MKCLDFDWQINEFMVYCPSTQLREKTMSSEYFCDLAVTTIYI